MLLLQVLMWVGAIVVGCVVGKKVVHQLFLRESLRLSRTPERSTTVKLIRGRTTQSFLLEALAPSEAGIPAIGQEGMPT